MDRPFVAGPAEDVPQVVELGVIQDADQNFPALGLVDPPFGRERVSRSPCGTRAVFMSARRLLEPEAPAKMDSPLLGRQAPLPRGSLEARSTAAEQTRCCERNLLRPLVQL